MGSEGFGTCIQDKSMLSRFCNWMDKYSLIISMPSVLVWSFWPEDELVVITVMENRRSSGNRVFRVNFYAKKYRLVEIRL